MKNLKFTLKSLLLLLGIQLLFISCTKDNLSTNNIPIDSDRDQEVSDILSHRSKDHSPGDYSIEDGMLVFPDEESFHQTKSFINNSSATELQFWRSSLSFETPGIAYTAFQDATCCDQIQSQSQLDLIEQQFTDRISISVNEKDERDYEVKTKIFEEFVNLDGIFKVGTYYYRVAGTKLFSILNGDLSLVGSIDENTQGIKPEDLDFEILEGELSEGKTVIVETDIETRSDGDCCPGFDFKNTSYDEKKRLRVAYHVYDVGRAVDFGPAGIGYEGAFRIKTVVTNRKRKQFIFKYWSCEKTELSLNASFTVWSKYGSTETTTNHVISKQKSNECTITDSKDFLVSISFNNNLVLQACVEDVEVVGTNMSEPISSTVDCSIDEDLDPRVKFYGNNTAVTYHLCTIHLSDPVGHVNFKEDSYGCENDEARSARFIDISEGMKFRIYDNPDGKTNDDYVVITAKRDFTNKALLTFEESTSDDDWTVEYHKDNGLDGKVSSFRDY